MFANMMTDKERLLAKNRLIYDKLFADWIERSAQYHKDAAEHKKMEFLWKKGQPHRREHDEQWVDVHNIILSDDPLERRKQELVRDHWELEEMTKRYYCFKYENADFL